MDFYQLVNDIYQLDNEEKKKSHFNDLFVKTNFKNYEYEESLQADEIKAIKYMFNSKHELCQRAREALDIDPFCVEAIFVYYVLGVDAYVYMMFNDYYAYLSSYGELTIRQKVAFVTILDLYVEFLLDIFNYTQAIKVEKVIIKLTNNIGLKEIDRLSTLYYAIEDDNEFYKLYCEVESFPLESYILLILTLLKHDEELKAKQVLWDMQKNIKNSDYIDHIWDIQEDNKELMEFYNSVDGCYEQICSVPYFFSWCSQNKK